MWFTENPWPPMLIAGLAALVCVALWNSGQRRVYLLLAAVCALLCGGFYYLERAIVTEGEKLQALTVKLCEDFQKKDATVVRYFSDTAPELKLLIMGAMAMVDVKDDLRLTDFQTNLTNENSRGTVHFRANATLAVQGVGDVGHQPARIVLTYQREKDEWKIIAVDRLNPLTGKKMDTLAKEPG